MMDKRNFALAPSPSALVTLVLSALLNAGVSLYAASTSMRWAQLGVGCYLLAIALVSYRRRRPGSVMRSTTLGRVILALRYTSVAMAVGLGWALVISAVALGGQASHLVLGLLAAGLIAPLVAERAIMSYLLMSRPLYREARRDLIAAAAGLAGRGTSKHVSSTTQLTDIWRYMGYPVPEEGVEARVVIDRRGVAPLKLVAQPALPGLPILVIRAEQDTLPVWLYRGVRDADGNIRGDGKPPAVVPLEEVELLAGALGSSYMVYSARRQ